MEKSEQFQTLGAQMVEFGVQPKTLESRITQAGTDLSDDQIKSLVTGYIDEFMERGDHLENLYDLVHGFARFLYNGSFESMREGLFVQMADTINNHEHYAGSFSRFLKEKGDEKAKLRIAELVVEKAPKVTFDWYQAEDRERMLREIVDLHRNNEKERDVLISTLKELGETKELRVVAREHASNEKMESLWSSWTAPDSWNLLEKYGELEDFTFLAEQWQDRNALWAYRAICKVNGPTSNPLRRKLKKKVIEEMPSEAKDIFNKMREKGLDSKDAIDGLVAVGERYIALKLPVEAIDVFDDAQYKGELLAKAGHMILDRDIDEKSYRSLRDMPDRVKPLLKEIALGYVLRGGDIEAALPYVPLEIGDAANRTIAQKIAAIEDDKHGFHAESAYQRMQLVENKSAEDLELISELRPRIIQHARWRVFKAYKDGQGNEHGRDKEGLRMFIDHWKNKKVEDGYYRCDKREKLYHVAQELGDEKIVQQMRENLLQNGLQRTLNVFEEANDVIGVQYVKDQIAPGLNQEIVQQFLAKTD